MGKLKNKIALVSGAGRGIGRAVVLKLAGEGAALVVNDLDEETAQGVVDEIRQRGGKAVAFVGSVTADGFAERFVQSALDNFGGLDIIVNNAGYTMDALLGKMSDAAFDAMYQVHLKAPFQILRAASGFIIDSAKKEAEAGRPVYRKIVNISSTSGTSGNVGQANYSAMKSGVVGLTKTLAKEWGRFNVNVNCVAFGFIETRLTQPTEEKLEVEVDGGRKTSLGMPPKIIEGFKKMIPLGRAGTPEEAADAVYLLCCPESNYISGQTLLCSGGLAI